MIVKCKLCDKIFNKKLTDINRTKNNFCSKSCAAIFNNKSRVGMKLKGSCILCNTKISSTRKYCKQCLSIKRNFINDNQSLGEVIYKSSCKSSAYAKVRSRARVINTKILKIKNCQVCGYEKHVEVAHKKPISSFSEDTKLSIINHPSNLIILCPNCHWEFDN